MKRLLQKAHAVRYSVTAFNMIGYNSARAIIDGANALNAPVIIQISVKTIRLWGAKTIGKWMKDLAENSATPVALNLDHCTDLDITQRSIEAGWASVMFDGSALPFEENLRQSTTVYAFTQSANIGLEAELGAISGVEDDKVVLGSHTMLANYDECIVFRNARPSCICIHYPCSPWIL